MATPMSAEVSFYQDRVTGIRIAQLTAWPCVNNIPYFHDHFFTPDSRTLLFHSIPGPRGAGTADIYRVDMNGHRLARLTTGLRWSGLAMAADGKGFYYTSEGALWWADLETGEPQQVVKLPPGASGAGGGSLTRDGKVYVVQLVLASGEMGILRVYTDRAQGEVVHTVSRLSHAQVEPSEGRMIAYQITRPDNINQWWLPADGGEPRPFMLEEGTGHWMWVAETRRIVSTLLHPRGALLTVGIDDPAPSVVVEAPIYFWHAAVSRDGVWAVSDTNWPDQGLQLVHMPTGHFETLCMSDSDNGAWNHPHPSFSPDGSMVAFQSNRTGVPQVYLGHIPPEMKAQLAG